MLYQIISTIRILFSRLKYGWKCISMNKKILKILLYNSWIIVGIYIFYRCPFDYFLGIPCLGCGMTRAFLSLIHLDIKNAFYYHPLFPIIILIGMDWILEKVGVYKMPNKAKWYIGYSICFLFVITYLIRIQSDNSPIKIEIKESFFYRVVFSKIY